MSQKLPRNQRRKLARAAQQTETASPTPVEVIRRRWVRRFLLLAAIVVALPLLEVIAYQYRGILITVVNHSEAVVTDVKFTYSGGSFEAKQLKPGAEITHLARPDFSFGRGNFSTYASRISIVAPAGRFKLDLPRTGTVDYSAQETYAIEGEGVPGALRFQHSTRPGFPLGTIRDLLSKLGIR